MIFYTDITTNISNFCLLNIKHVNDKRISRKFMVLIDPSVYELKTSNEYSQIELLHEIAKKGLEYISIDYPCDMNVNYTDEFIEKSIKNNLLYKDSDKYIATIQYKFMDFIDFKKQFEYLESEIDFSKKIVGVGNLCRIMHTSEFTDKVFQFLQKKNYFYHIYGLGLKLIRKYVNMINCSIDSTKWTKAVTNEFKIKNGVCCRKFNRDKYFLEYMKEIEKFTKIIY